MTDIMKLKVDGVQVYPQTHEKAVVGLSEVIDAKMIEAGSGAVKSVNGKTGVVTLNAADIKALPDSTVIPNYTVATTTTDGLMSKADKIKVDSLKNTNATITADGYMSAADKKKLDGLNITFERIDTV